MPVFFIHTKNSDFRSRDEGAEYANAAVALASGVRSAIALIADEVQQGERSAAVEISVERENGVQVLCSIVAISVSPMLLATYRPDPIATRLS